MKLKPIKAVPDDVSDGRSFFLHDLELVYPHAPGRRIARVLDVNQRLAQRWSSGGQEPTERAREYVANQGKIADKIRPQEALERLITTWSEAGLDDEAIGAQLALMHGRLLDRDLE